MYIYLYISLYKYIHHYINISIYIFIYLYISLYIYTYIRVLHLCWYHDLTSYHLTSDQKRGWRRRRQVNLTRLVKFHLFPKHKCRTLMYIRIYLYVFVNIFVCTGSWLSTRFWAAETVKLSSPSPLILRENNIAAISLGTWLMSISMRSSLCVCLGMCMCEYVHV